MRARCACQWTAIRILNGSTPIIGSCTVACPGACGRSWSGWRRRSIATGPREPRSAHRNGNEVATRPPYSCTRPRRRGAAGTARHRLLTHGRSRRPPPAAAVRVCPPTGGGGFSPTSPRVRPGPLWPLPGRRRAVVKALQRKNNVTEAIVDGVCQQENTQSAECAHGDDNAEPVNKNETAGS